MKNFRVAVGFTCSLLGIWFAYWLLRSELIEDAVFATLVIAFMAIGLLIALFSQIAELSFSEFTIKLNKAQAAAEVTLEKLNRSLELTFVPLLSASKNISGAWGDATSPVDSRVPNFLELVESIKKANLLNTLEPNIAEAARVIALGQLHVFSYFVDSFHGKYPGPDLPTPDKVSVEALSAEGMKGTADRLQISEQELIKKILACADTYKTLHALTTL